jgi:hypothetical protein
VTFYDAEDFEIGADIRSRGSFSLGEVREFPVSPAASVIKAVLTITKVPLVLVRDSPSTRVNDLGLIEKVPPNVSRYHYDPVTLAPLGLLAEPEAKNVISTGDISLWQQNRVTVVALHIDSPGDIPDPLFADPGLIYIAFGNGTSGQHVVRTPYPGVRFNMYRTLSVYMKMSTCRIAQILLEGDAMFANFELESGVVGTMHQFVDATMHGLCTNSSGGERLVPVRDDDRFDRGTRVSHRYIYVIQQKQQPSSPPSLCL